MNKFIAVTTLIATLVVARLVLAELPVRASGPAITYDQCIAQGKKITICHATSSADHSYSKLTLSCDGIYGSSHGSAGHFSENGTPASGHEDDVFADENGLCPGETLPTVSPTPSPSATPTVSPTPSVSPSPSPSILIDSSPSPTPIVSPTPDVTPSPSASASPSVSPTPSPTATPQPGHQTSLATDNFVCNLDTLEVNMDVKDNGNGVEGVTVTFKYNNSTLEAKTNKDGRAKVTFTRGGNGPLTAHVDGYPEQSLFIVMPEKCTPIFLDPDRSNGVGGPGQVLGATTTKSHGQVLGASTLANTGSSDEVISYAMMSMGAVLMAFGARLYAKKA